LEGRRGWIEAVPQCGGVFCVKADSFDLEFIELTNLTIAESVIGLVPEKVARASQVLPIFASDRIIWIATSDPGDYAGLQTLSSVLNKDIVPVLVERGQLLTAIDRHYRHTGIE